MTEPREQARKLWEESNGELPLKDIAAQLGVPEGTLRSWKRRDKWGDAGATQRGKRTGATQRKAQRNAKSDAAMNRKRRAAVNRSLAARVERNEELEEWEKEFCIFFIGNYNATQAAWKTGRYSSLNSAKDGGWRMLQKPAVREEINRLKLIKRTALLADVDDLVGLHMRVAFGDMTDFAVWGYDEKRRANRMAVLSSDTVDGQLVREVSESAQGFKIKMQDKKASLDFLERFFLANPMDKHKQDYDNAKLELERLKVPKDEPATVGDDGFLEALESASAEVWQDGDEAPK